MDTAYTIVLTAFIIALFILSAFFSATETAYTSVNKTRIRNMANDGNRKAQRVLSNCENYERLLTTVLVGNNIVNIASSTLVTAILTSLYGAEKGTVIATILMITVLLVFGEITPKTLAKRHPERVSMAFSGAIRAVMIVLAPVVWIFMKVTSAVTRAAGDDGTAKEPSMTEEELSVMIDEIQQEGTIEKSEGDLIKSAIEFDDIRVSEICVPRVDVIAVDVNTDVETMRKVFAESEFSRVPVYEGTIDHIIGAVFIKDFFMKYTSGKRFAVTDIIRPVKFVPETASIATVMSDLQKAKLHMAVALDDFGGTMGIVTMEDILEELVGEIWDESDIVNYPITKEADGTYTVLADANIYDVMGKIGRSFEDGDYDSSTVGGYICYRLERIPKVGDEVVYEDVRMAVKSVRSRRIREVTFAVDPSLIQEDGSEKEGN